MNRATAISFLFLAVLAWGGVATAQPQADATSDVDQGAALYLEGDAAAAVPLLEAGVADIEASRGPDHLDLVTPLGFLGAALHDLQRHEKALQALARARAIAAEHEGPLNRTQLPLIYVEAESLRALGRIDEAESRQREAVDVVRSHHGADSMEAALALGRLAEWLAGQRRHDESLILFSRAIKQAHEAAGGNDSPEMLPLLQGMAVAQLASGNVPERALSLVQRMVEVADAHEGFDTGTRIEARLLLGDVLMRFSREAQALTVYQQAWTLADAAGDDDWLQKLAQPRKAAGRLDPVDQVPERGRYYRLQYDLLADGRPANARLLETNASPTIADWALQQFREMRFQPAIVAGRAAAQADQTGVFVD